VADAADRRANPEGELCLRLRVHDGCIAHLDIESTRQDVAGVLLRGRSPAQAQAAVPLLFSVCSRSQGAASALAFAAAAGQGAIPHTLAACGAAVAEEMVREHSLRALFDWPLALHQKPSSAAIVAARSALAWNARAQSSDDVRRIARDIAAQAFGGSVEEWLALRTPAQMRAWAAAGSTACACFIRSSIDDAEQQSPAAHGTVPDPQWLESADLANGGATMLEALAAACDTDARFAQRPTWFGAPLETGALARHRSDPLIAELLRSSRSRVPARLIARLRELALLLTGAYTPSVGVFQPAGEGAIAWVENARGLLLHRVLLRDGSVDAYRIVAPTEWNFHPEGALAAELLGMPARDLTGVKHRAEQLVHSLDPCVPCRIEVDGA